MFLANPSSQREEKCPLNRRLDGLGAYNGAHHEKECHDGRTHHTGIMTSSRKSSQDRKARTKGLTCVVCRWLVTKARRVCSRHTVIRKWQVPCGLVTMSLLRRGWEGVCYIVVGVSFDVDILEDTFHILGHSWCEHAKAFAYIFFECFSPPPSHFLDLCVGVSA